MVYLKREKSSIGTSNVRDHPGKGRPKDNPHSLPSVVSSDPPPSSYSIPINKEVEGGRQPTEGDRGFLVSRKPKTLTRGNTDKSGPPRLPIETNGPRRKWDGCGDSYQI